jgi:UDP:flavonoid glycosyltransferase YjiC (YdhE family)
VYSIWEGLSGVINEFRTSILRLPAMLDRTAYSVLDNNRVPWTYCWSPELLPKPKDWGKNIEISGFYFLDGEDGYQPPADLARFLTDGPAPVYIGFGSVVISDPEAVTGES